MAQMYSMLMESVMRKRSRPKVAAGTEAPAVPQVKPMADVDVDAARKRRGTMRAMFSRSLAV